MMGSDPFTVLPTSPDEHARQLIETAIDQTLVVEAAAGTGKTTELVRRIVRVIRGGPRRRSGDRCSDVHGESGRGVEAATPPASRRGAPRCAPVREMQERLDAAVQNLEEAHVSTIHGFCADLLRERPVEAAIDPLFRVLTEGQAQRLFDEAFAAWFQETLAQPPEGVRRSLRRSSRGIRSGEVDEDGPMERLRRAGFSLTEWRDFPGAVDS